MTGDYDCRVLSTSDSARKQRRPEHGRQLSECKHHLHQGRHRRSRGRPRRRFAELGPEFQEQPRPLCQRCEGEHMEV